MNNESLSWWKNLGLNQTQKFIMQGELCSKYFGKSKNVDNLSEEAVLHIFKQERKEVKKLKDIIADSAEQNVMTDDEKVTSLYDIFDSLSLEQKQRVHGYVSGFVS